MVFFRLVGGWGHKRFVSHLVAVYCLLLFSDSSTASTTSALHSLSVDMYFVLSPTNGSWQSAFYQTAPTNRALIDQMLTFDIARFEHFTFDICFQILTVTFENV